MGYTLRVCAYAGTRAREGKCLEMPLVRGFRLCRIWKSDGGTTVPPIFPEQPALS